MKKGRLFLLLTTVALFVFAFALPIEGTTSLYLIARCVLYLLTNNYTAMDYVTYIGVASMQLIPLVTGLVALIAPILLIVSLVLLLIANIKDKKAIPSYVLTGVAAVLLLVPFVTTLLGAGGFGVILFAFTRFYRHGAYSFGFVNWLSTSNILTMIVNLIDIVIYFVLLGYALIPVILFILSIVFGIIQMKKDKKALEEQQQPVEEELIEQPQE